MAIIMALYNIGFCYTLLGDRNNALDSYRTCKWFRNVEAKQFDNDEVLKIIKFVQESVREEGEKLEKMKEIIKEQENLLLKEQKKPRVYLTQNEILEHIDKLWIKSGNEDNFTSPKYIKVKLSGGKEEWGTILRNISAQKKEASKLLINSKQNRKCKLVGKA